MADDTGTFRIDIEIENPLQAGVRRVVSNVLVDTRRRLPRTTCPLCVPFA